MSFARGGPATNASPVEPKPDPTAGKIRLVLDDGASLEDRLMAARALGRDLTADHVARLREFVRRKGAPSAVRNDVLDVLERQRSRPHGLGEDLVAMWNDQDEAADWRDYCLRHMAAVYEFDADRSAIDRTLLEAAGDKDSAFAGTAMLSLGRLGRDHPHLAGKVKELAREAVLPGEAGGDRAVMALQAARLTGDRSVLARARELAADADAMVRLRMSAVGTIGELGEQGDIPLLEKLCKDQESRVRRAARNNLDRLRERLAR